MYSLPTSTTFAVFTIASAASTAPMRPLVSIIPRASNGMRAELYQIAGEGRYAMTIKAFRIRVAPSAVDRRDRSPTARAESAGAGVPAAPSHSEGSIAPVHAARPPRPGVDFVHADQ